MGCEVLSGVDMLSDVDVLSGDVLSGRDVLSGGDVFSGGDVVDSGNVVGVVEDGGGVDSAELESDDEISCPTAAAILVPLPSLQQSLFPPPQHQEPSLHSVTATFCEAALPSTPASWYHN